MGSVSILPAPFTPERRYYPLSRFLKERFGGKVYRVTIDGGFTCPNVDGTAAVGGCVFCDNRSFSPNRRLPRTTVRAQVERGIRLLDERYHAKHYIAYFQAATNTYAPVARLERLYDEALEHPRVVGLAIGTRPDCLSEPVLDLLERFARDRFVCLEIGLQTIHDRSLAWMNRGHDFACFLDAVKRAQDRCLDLCVHVILGLPDESRDEMLATADVLASLPIQGVKIHNLHVVKDTPLEAQFLAGTARMLDRDEYVGLTVDFLERLPSTMVMHRLTGDAPPDYLIAPLWCLDKAGLLRDMQAELTRRDSWQGKQFVLRPPAWDWEQYAGRGKVSLI
jgi:radical SAM protein (TIGR01212 family)